MDQITKQLSKFGLEENEINIYLLLLKKGTSSATQISKLSKTPKTTVYRTLELLKKKRLVDEIVGKRGRLFDPAPYENLKHTITEQKKKLQSIEESLPKLINLLSETTKEDLTKSKIKYHSGLEGLKQVTWNSSKAKDILRIFEIKDMSAFLNYDFCEITRLEFVKNRVSIRELTNEKKQPGWTNVAEMVKNFWELRYIDPKELTLEFEMLVYNDVYVMYNYQDDEIFCAEIYNEKLAQMQKQIFDFIWIKGKPFRVVNEKGATELISKS